MQPVVELPVRFEPVLLDDDAVAFIERALDGVASEGRELRATPRSPLRLSAIRTSQLGRAWTGK
jgi:hypothetical protein